VIKMVKNPDNNIFDLPDGNGFISRPPKLNMQQYTAWVEETLPYALPHEREQSKQTCAVEFTM
jgi:hypothetical protein